MPSQPVKDLYCNLLKYCCQAPCGGGGITVSSTRAAPTVLYSSNTGSNCKQYPDSSDCILFNASQWTRRSIFLPFQVPYSTTSVQQIIKKRMFGSISPVFSVKAIEFPYFKNSHYKNRHKNIYFLSFQVLSRFDWVHIKSKSYPVSVSTFVFDAVSTSVQDS